MKQTLATSDELERLTTDEWNGLMFSYFLRFETNFEADLLKALNDSYDKHYSLKAKAGRCIKRLLNRNVRYETNP